MKKTLIFMFGAALLVFMGCQMGPSGSYDDKGKDNGTELPGSEDKLEKEDSISPVKPEGDYLDLNLQTLYEMNAGESIVLWSEKAVSYEVLEGFDVVSLCSENVLSALIPGEAKLRMEDSEGYYYYCYVTVNAGSNDDPEADLPQINALVGKWVDEDSYIEFYANGTGYMKVFLKGAVVQDVSFSWSDWSNSFGHFLTISNANDYLNKDYTITVNGSSLTLKGYLAFGKPQTTTWIKQ